MAERFIPIRLTLTTDDRQFKNALSDMDGSALRTEKRFKNMMSGIEANALKTTNSIKTGFSNSLSGGLNNETLLRQMDQLRIGVEQLSRGSLGGLPNIIKAFAIGSGEAKQKTAGFTDTLKILDRQLQISGTQAGAAKSIFATFERSLLSAARGGSVAADTLRRDFKAVGIELEQALLRPEKAFTSLLNNLSTFKKNSNQELGAANILGTTSASSKGTFVDFAKLGAAKNAATAITELEAAETAATAATGGLSAATIGAGFAIGAVVVAAGAAVVGLAALEVQAVKSTLSFAEQTAELSRLSGTYGISTQTLAEWEAAGKLVGLTLNDVTAAQKEFLKLISGSDDESKKFIGTLSKIGVTAQDLKNPVAAFEEVQKAIGNAANSTQAARVAVELYDEKALSAAQASQLLNDQSSALNQTLRAMGVEFNQSVIAQAQEADRTYKLLGVSGDLLKQKLAIEMLPAVIQGTAYLNTATRELAPAFSFFGGVAENVLVGVLAGLRTVYETARGVKNLLVGIATLDFKQAADGFAEQATTSFYSNFAKIKGDIANQTKAFQSQIETQAKLQDNIQKALQQKAVKLPKAGGGRGGAGIDDSKALRAAILELERADKQALTNLTKEQLREQEAALRDSYQLRIIDTKTYFAEKLRIEQGALRTELEQNRQSIAITEKEVREAAQASNKAKLSEVVRLATQLKRLRGEQSVVESKLNALPQANLNAQQLEFEKLGSTFDKLTLELKELQGAEESAFSYKIAQEYGDTIKQATQAGRQDILNLVEAITKLKLAQDDLLRPAKDAALRFDIRNSELAAKQSQIDALRNAGALTDVQAETLAINQKRQYRDLLLSELEIRRQSLEQQKALTPLKALEFDKELASLNAQIAGVKTLGTELTKTESIQLRLAKQGQIDYSQLNDGVLELLASQKGLTETFADFRTNSVKTVFDGLDRGIDALTKKFGAAGDAVRQFIKDLARLAATKIFERLFNQQTTGGSGTSAGGGFLDQIKQLFKGGGGNGGGFSIPGMGPGGTPYYNPSTAASSASSASGGGFFSKVSNFFSNFGGSFLGSRAGTVKLPAARAIGNIVPTGIDPVTGAPILGSTTTGGVGGVSALSSLGAGGLLLGGGLLGKFAGGDSKIGQLLGFGGGTALAGAAGAAGLFGGGIAAALPALFSNPFTAIIGAGLVGGALLFRLFGNRDLKKLRGVINSEYAIDVRSNDTLKQVKEVGQSTFGKSWKDKMLDTIRLEPSKNLILNYAERTGQNTAKLTLEKRKLDPNDDVNQFIRPIAREYGGRVWPGQDFLVGERRAEVVRFDRPGTVYPSVQAYQQQNNGGSGQQAVPIGLFQAILGELMALRAQMQPVNGKDFVVAQLKEAAPEAAQIVESGQRSSGSYYALNTLQTAGY